MMQLAIEALGVLLVAYLFGSLPTAFLLVRWHEKKDLRKEGTGNIGTLNALRASKSKPLALTVLIVDLAKGALPTWLVFNYFGHDYILMAAVATGVLVGHVAPVWLKFHGGRGLAVMAGALLVIEPVLVPIWIAIWLIFYLALRTHIVASIIATFLLPLIVFFSTGIWFDASLLLVLLPLCFIIILKHLERLPGLLNHPEN
jgi:glycerol-3-phosphate acyltransferase PlsY